MKKTSISVFKASLLGGILASGSFMGLQAKTNLKDAITNATIDGFAFGRIHSLHGQDGAGTRYQFRFKPTITTGEVHGFSASAGIFFSKGSGTPDSNRSDNDIGGSRGDMHSSFVDRFNIGDFYITYNAKEKLGTNTIFRLGQKTPGTPFNDNNLDRALGFFFENKDSSYANVVFQIWDSWMGDDIFVSQVGLTSTDNPNKDKGGFSVTKQMGFGNNVFMLGLKGGVDFTEDSNLAYQAWYTYINRYIDAMTFADIAYTHKFGNQSISLLGQISYTALTANPHIFTDDANFAGLYSATGNGKGYNYAKTRGMYNIRLDYKMNFATDEETSKPVGSLGVALGFAGSFANGFGTLIDNTGGLKLGGQLWNGFSGSEANGFGIFGVGGFDKSSIIVPYLKVEGAYKKFGATLDLAYVDATHFFHLKKGSTNRPGNNLNGAENVLYGKNNHIKAAKFFETSVSASYKFTNSISASAHYSYLFGGLEFGRFKFQVNYVF